MTPDERREHLTTLARHERKPMKKGILLLLSEEIEAPNVAAALANSFRRNVGEAVILAHLAEVADREKGVLEGIVTTLMAHGFDDDQLADALVAELEWSVQLMVNYATEAEGALWPYGRERPYRAAHGVAM